MSYSFPKFHKYDTIQRTDEVSVQWGPVFIQDVRGYEEAEYFLTFDDGSEGWNPASFIDGQYELAPEEPVVGKLDTPKPGDSVVAGKNRRDIGVYVGYEGGLTDHVKGHIVAVLTGSDAEPNLGWEIRRYNHVRITEPDDE